MGVRYSKQLVNSVISTTHPPVQNFSAEHIAMSGMTTRRQGATNSPTNTDDEGDTDDDDQQLPAFVLPSGTAPPTAPVTQQTTVRPSKLRAASIPRYDGTKQKYTSWSTIFAKYIMTVYNLCIITGSNWIRIDPLLDAEILFVLLTSTSGRAQKLIIGKDTNTTQKAWTALQQDFAQGHAEKLQHAMLKLHDVTWIRGKSLANSVEKLNSKISEIGLEIESYGGQQSQMEQIRYHILKILPRDFDTVRSEIQRTTTVDMIFNILTSHSVLEDTRDSSVKPAFWTQSNQTSNNKRPTSKGKFTGTCFNCKKTGHRKADCRSQTAMVTGEKLPTRPCKFCGGKHWNSQCPSQTGNKRNTQSKASEPDATSEAVANFVTNNYEAIMSHGNSQKNIPRSTSAKSSTPSMATLLGAAALLANCKMGDGLHTFTAPNNTTPDCLVTKYAMSNTTDNSYNTTHDGFVCDNGCSWSLVTDPNLLEDYKTSPNLPGFVTGPGTEYSVVGHGTLRLILNTVQGQQEISIPNVRYCPRFQINLLSDEQLVRSLKLKFTHTVGGRVLQFANGDKSHLLRQPSGLYTLDCVIANPKQHGLSTQQSVPTTDKQHSLFPDTHTMQQLHRTFGHRNYNDIKRLADQNGWHLDPTETRMFCDICTKSKRRIAKEPSTKSSSPLNGPGIIVSTDYIGPFDTGVGDVTGAYIFVDNYSRHPLAYPVKHKSEMLSCFKQYLLDSGLRINDTVQGPQILQSDTSSDIFSQECKQFCTDHGIRQRCSPPYTQAQNGLAERHIRTIKSMVRTLLMDSNLPNKFWPYALAHSCLLLALLPNNTTNKSPFELQYGIPPNINLAKIAPFGERCIIPNHANTNKSDFTQPPNIQGYYLGYSHRSKSMFVWICHSKRVRESNNVSFPFISHNDTPMGGTWHLPSAQYNPDVDDDDDTDTSTTDQNSTYKDFIIEDNETYHHDDVMDFHIAESIDNYHDDTPPPNQTTSTNPYHTWATHEDDSDTEPEQSFMSSFMAFLSYEAHVNDAYDPIENDYHMNMALSTVVKYEDHRKCKKDPLWESQFQPAHDKEMASLETHNVFTRIKRKDVPKNANIVKSKMIYALKLAADGSTDKFKARLVAKGYSQLWGIDYFESYAPTPMHYIFRMLITLALKFNLVIRQFDISTAFLHGELNEDIYMAFPPGMEERDADGNDLVVKLNYGLYGLKQGARSWNSTFHKSLTAMGYTRSQYEPCLYTKGKVWIYVFVDDLIVIAPTDAEVDALHEALKQEYTLTGGDPIKSFLGMHLTRSADGRTMYLSQKALIEQLADKFPTIKSSRKVSTPMPPDLQFYKADCISTDDPKYDETMHSNYRKILGTLLYVCGKTRPDLCYSLSKASTVMSAPSPKHYSLIWHIFRYVYHTRDFKLVMKPNDSPDVDLVGFTDSDWARDISTRKSTSGYATQLNGVTISSTSKSQTGVAHSSAEAELVAATATCKDIIHQRRILCELGFPQKTPTVLNCDSQSAMDITNNPIVGSRLRHVQISDFWCRELTDRNIVKLEKIAGTNNLADIFTKPLAGQPFYQYRSGLGIMV